MANNQAPNALNPIGPVTKMMPENGLPKGIYQLGEAAKGNTGKVASNAQTANVAQMWEA